MPLSGLAGTTVEDNPLVRLLSPPSSLPPLVGGPQLQTGSAARGAPEGGGGDSSQEEKEAKSRAILLRGIPCPPAAAEDSLARAGASPQDP
jgi:hypothetical protein